MDDDNQIEVPPSFLALFTSSSGHRLLQPIATVRARYELCEDLAQMLVDQAGTAAFKSGAPESEILARIQSGLTGSDASMQPREAAWIVTRLAELLGWEPPAPG